MGEYELWVNFWLIHHKCDAVGGGGQAWFLVGLVNMNYGWILFMSKYELWGI